MKLSPVISFSLLLGIISTGLTVLIGLYFNSHLLHSLKFYLFAISGGILISIISSIVFKYYIKLRFEKIYKSIDQVFNSDSEDYGENAQEKIENWVSKKSNEIKELKTTEAYRREFFGNLAHELKTPVFSVEGYILTLLEGGLEDQKNNRRFLEKAAKGIDRITKVIQDMDTITKIESGVLKLDFKKVSLLDLISNVIDELSDIAKKKNITVHIEKPQVMEVYVSGDKVKLEQVFTNLIVNSFHYGNQDGKTIISISENKNKVEISVNDDGVGIAQDHLPRLFERFYRVEKSRDRNSGGSGIGLAIVKHIVEAHDQKIKVESDKENGTTFTFCLDKY